jgi:hypothetical protein
MERVEPRNRQYFMRNRYVVLVFAKARGNPITTPIGWRTNPPNSSTVRARTSRDPSTGPLIALDRVAAPLLNTTFLHTLHHPAHHCFPVKSFGCLACLHDRVPAYHRSDTHSRAACFAALHLRTVRGTAAVISPSAFAACAQPLRIALRLSSSSSGVHLEHLRKTSLSLGIP